MTLSFKILPVVIVMVVGCTEQLTSEPMATMTVPSATTTTTSIPKPVPTTSVAIISTTTTSAPAVTEVSALIDSDSTVPSSDGQVKIENPEWLRPELDYVFPIPAGVNSGYQGTHSGYPATDVFAPCDAPIISPVHGVIHDLRRSDPWDSATDDPYARGGKFVSILGDDNVRYYLAHFEAIEEQLQIGTRVVPGQKLGDMGSTGRSSACHLHFSISPLCPVDEWWVRRGVIWPYIYFDAWRSGVQLSPAGEVEAWSAANPSGCLEP